MNKTYRFLLYLGILLISGCTSYESLLSYNESSIPSSPQNINNFKPLHIKPHDLLSIQISSTDAVAVQAFQLSNGATGEQNASNANEYLVNNEGYIEFPTLGRIELKGLEIEAAKDKILGLLSPYFAQNPIVQVKLNNFTVNVHGEVGKGGAFSVNNDRLTVIEAVIMAGDFTSYSRRDSVLIIRENEGIREFVYVDFNSAEIFNSPHFYLQQNDVIYIKPSKNKTSTVRDPSSRYLPWVSTLVSVAALVFAVTR